MSPIVRKSLVALLASIAALLGASGCNFSATPQAATVGKVSISQGQLDADLSGVAADNGYLCSITHDFQVGLTTTGAGQGTYDTHFSDLVLSYLIDSQLAQDEASGEGLKLTPLAYTLATQQLEAGVGTNVQGCTQSPSSVMSALPADYRSGLNSLYAALDVMVAHAQGVQSLTPAGLSSYLAAHRADAILACIDFIEVSSLAKARTVENELALGANFATVASKNSVASTDSGGCDPPQVLPTGSADALKSLQPGGVTTPIPFQSNYLIFKLLKRKPQSVTDVQNLLAGTAQQQFGALLGKISTAAKVTVDPSYGTWPVGGTGSGVQPGTVVPPTGPPSQFVPAPSAAVGGQAGAPTPGSLPGSTGNT